ncbi:hypothetical protein [Polaribacter vadi]|uniref:hypothetical protein n=1 Tax=Polaribacter vadi TaxID=1774273 RepID=UPI0030ED452B|tara:strand:+ start:3282 stop:3494 length:213 start_codon:yes stop_codon:yes gene_type:complete
MFKKNFLIFLFLIFIAQSSYSQCAMCKAVVETGDMEMAEGVNNGISYLMVFPYLLIGLLGYALYRYKKKA